MTFVEGPKCCGVYMLREPTRLEYSCLGCGKEIPAYTNKIRTDGTFEGVILNRYGVVISAPRMRIYDLC